MGTGRLDLLLYLPIYDMCHACHTVHTLMAYALPPRGNVVRHCSINIPVLHSTPSSRICTSDPLTTINALISAKVQL